MNISSLGRRFLTGGELLELWIESDQSTVDQIIWKSVWKCETPTPVYDIEFSSDGAYFASRGKVCPLMYPIIGPFILEEIRCALQYSRFQFAFEKLLSIFVCKFGMCVAKFQCSF